MCGDVLASMPFHNQKKVVALLDELARYVKRRSGGMGPGADVNS
jgi:hypothetical protein